MDVEPLARCGGQEAQAQGEYSPDHGPDIYGSSTAHLLTPPPDARARPPLLLHGRQVPRLLQHHDRLLSRPDRRHLRFLRDRPLPAYRRQGAFD